MEEVWSFSADLTGTGMGVTSILNMGSLAGAGQAPAMFLLQSNPLSTPFAPIILMVVIFYLVLFLPMRRRQKKTDQMLQSLKNGDNVVTNGGVIGTIVTLGESDNTVTLRVKPDNVKIEFARSAITGLLTEDEEKK
jgi:preprotein translocase subunit YajC